jgi:hypothetical protein
MLTLLATTEVQSYQLKHQQFSFTLVDTPGFDDTDLSDSDILRLLAKWLAISYQKGERLSGILYLHRILDPRMQGSALNNLFMFKSLCGDDNFKNVILGTTFWGAIEKLPGGATLGNERLEELTQTPSFWGTMIKNGSEAIKIPETQEAARELLLRFTAKPAATLKIQDEIINNGVDLSRTAALRATLVDTEELRARNERLLEETRQRHAQRLKAQEEARAREKKRVEREAEEKLRQQKLENERLQREYKRKEAERKKKEQEAYEEQKRLEKKIEREKAEMEARVAALKRKEMATKRHLKQQRYMNNLQTLMTRLALGVDNGVVICRLDGFRESGYCDNCFTNFGINGYYSTFLSLLSPPLFFLYLPTR